MPARLDDIALLHRLVQFDSTSARSNRAIAAWIADYLEGCGCRVELLSDAAGDKLNLLAWAGPAPSADPARAGLVLSGHLDTVPADEPDWRTAPFDLVEHAGRLHGRGAVDMKGFIALALNRLCGAAPSAGPRAPDLARPLCLLLTHDEEVGSLGAQRFVREFPRLAELPRSVLVGEPTGGALVSMHKGHLKLRLTTAGRAAHSGLPHLGANAIERAADVLLLLRQAAAEMRQERSPSSIAFPECPHPVLNIGLIRGGRAVNIVPDACTIDLGVRLLPGQETPACVSRLRALLAGLPADVRDGLQFEIVNDSPPMLCDPRAPVCTAIGALLGQAEPRGVSFASDAGTLARHDFQCVLWGPGQMEHAHRANESLSVAEFEEAGRMLERIIHRCCGAAA